MPTAREIDDLLNEFEDEPKRDAVESTTSSTASAGDIDALLAEFDESPKSQTVPEETDSLKLARERYDRMPSSIAGQDLERPRGQRYGERLLVNRTVSPPVAMEYAPHAPGKSALRSPGFHAPKHVRFGSEVTIGGGRTAATSIVSVCVILACAFFAP